MRDILIRVHRSEQGHWQPLPGVVVSAGGVIALAIGAASDTDWLTIAGGIVAGVGGLAYDVLRHTRVDYELFSRLDKLEKP